MVGHINGYMNNGIRCELFNNIILEIVLPDKKHLLIEINDLKSKEFIVINGKGFNNGRLIILNKI